MTQKELAAYESGYDTSKPYTETQLLENLSRFADEIGHTPKYREMHEDGPHYCGAYQRRWDTWNNALEAAGLEPNREREVSKEQIIDEIKRLAEELGRVPSARQMNEDGRHSCRTAQTHFGSWNDAVEAAGFDTRRGDENQEWQKGENNPVWSGDWETKNCELCGSEYKVRPFETDRRFCTQKCRNESRSERFSGEGNPQWDGGYRNRYGYNWDEQRKQALERDSYTCRRCGMANEEHIEEHDASLHVHHIVRKEDFRDESGDLVYEEANKLENLITLCAGCHAALEGVPLDNRR